MKYDEINIIEELTVDLCRKEILRLSVCEQSFCIEKKLDKIILTREIIGRRIKTKKK